MKAEKVRKKKQMGQMANNGKYKKNLNINLKQIIAIMTLNVNYIYSSI